MAFTLGLFIFVKQRNRAIGRAFVIMNASAFIWAISYFFWQRSKDVTSALFWCRALTVGAAFIFPAYFHFVTHLLGRWKEIKKWVLISYSMGIFVTIFVGTPLIINRLEPLLIFPFWPKAGPLYAVQILNYYIFPGIAIYLMWKEYPNASNVMKSQIKFIILGGVIGFLSGTTNNPQWYGVKIYPIFNGTVWLYTLFVFYAIIRYRLMEIDTVIHRTFLWLVTLLLVILPIGLAVTFSFDWIVSLSRLAKLALTSSVLIFFVWYYSKLKPRIDHFFRRRKYDYYTVLGEIGQKIGSELDINNVVNRLFRELKDVLYIRNGLAFVQQPGEQDYTEAGSIGYDTILDSQKPEKVSLAHQGALSLWLSSHQKALEREQIEVDPQYAPIKEEALAFLNQNSIEVLISVIMEGKVNALVGIGKKENLQAYTIKDIELLENMGKQIGITIDNAMHHEDIVEKERLAEEMKLGREIQMNLLPRVIPHISGLTVQGLMQPAKEIGGDYYDFITLQGPGEQGVPASQTPSVPAENLAIVIGDVSGKGVAAGLLMAMAKTAIHTLSQEEVSPKQILLRTNNILNQHIGGQKFMTMLYFRWQPETKTLTYSSAGHEHILIYRTEPKGDVFPTEGKRPLLGRVESIQSGGFMLGMIPDISQFLEDRTITLQKGDKVVLYTDGVTEARNTQEDLFGLPRLIEAVSKHSSKPAETLLNSLKDEVYSFIGTREQYDDITLVVMEAT